MTRLEMPQTGAAFPATAEAMRNCPGVASDGPAPSVEPAIRRRASNKINRQSLQASRRTRLGNHHLPPTSGAARASPHDLASWVSWHNVAAALRARISRDVWREVILRTNIGADHVVEYWKQL